MSKVSANNSDRGQHFGTTNDNDLVVFQHDSKTISFYYSQLVEHSKQIRDVYLFSDILNQLPQKIRIFQEENQILSENIELFFQLSHKNFDIEEDFTLTYIQCVDLLKISKFLDVPKLSNNIKQYIHSHISDVDFAIQMIEYDSKNIRNIEICKKVENLLIERINECFTNENFKKLPLEVIYRVINKSSPHSIDSNKLFDIIVSSLSQFCVLFQFIDLQKLSDDRLDELCTMYSKSNENKQHCFDYLKCNLNFIKEINGRKKNLEKMNEEQQNKLRESEKASSQLQGQLDDSKKLIIEQQDKVKNLESKVELLQNEVNDSNNVNKELLNKIKDLEKQIAQLQNMLENSKKK